MFQSILYAVLVALPASAMALNICKLLETQMPGLVSYPISGLYNSSLATYYSAQEREINPACIFKPTSTSEVSKFVQAVTANRGTRFAVRGGGHTLFSGAANIDNGITVDMRSMKSVTLSRDHKVAQIGAGSIFSDVYPQLTGYNLTVMGARVPGIGVGGFVTGGKYLDSEISGEQKLTRAKVVSPSYRASTDLVAITFTDTNLFLLVVKLYTSRRIPTLTFG